MSKLSSPKSSSKSYYSRSPAKARRIVRRSSGCGCGGKKPAKTTDSQNQTKPTSASLSLPVLETHETKSSLKLQTQLPKHYGDQSKSTPNTIKENSKFSKETTVQPSGTAEHSSWLKNIAGWFKKFRQKSMI
ncbi:hypothetical protein [Domibacillus mangrovi]|uniref:Uncharacterized protein n=1 Tax=Domibacillus mangrovi TaxID=1714354 RepID=A0A1Q5P6J1_9BACI|nr:hypothetical protein [Domibacillus mangrovi]OKL37761.1 hypothetical protein BLL40_02745 [Domibacillus mangrovi]